MSPRQTPSLAIVTIFLLCLSTITISLRFWGRHSIKYLGLDDLLTLIGQILFVGTSVAVIIGSYNGFNALDIHLTNEQIVIGLQILYCLACTCIKSSICVSLIRLSNTRTVTYPAYAVMTISCIAGIANVIIDSTLCKPINAMWDPSAGTCVSASVIMTASYLLSAASILTDFSCVLPVRLLWNLNYNWKMKAPMVCILSFGALASTATIIRIPYFRYYTQKTDHLHGVATIVLWSVVELGMGLSAGSAAALRLLLRWIYTGSMIDSEPGRYDAYRRRRRGDSLFILSSGHYG